MLRRARRWSPGMPRDRGAHSQGWLPCEPCHPFLCCLRLRASKGCTSSLFGQPQRVGKGGAASMCRSEHLLAAPAWGNGVHIRNEVHIRIGWPKGCSNGPHAVSRMVEHSLSCCAASPVQVRQQHAARRQQANDEAPQHSVLAGPVTSPCVSQTPMQALCSASAEPLLACRLMNDCTTAPYCKLLLTSPQS